MPIHPSMPQQIPDLPPSNGSPWPAEVVQAHRGLQAGFQASRAALNLNESDAIHLGHYLHQAKSIMIPVVEALRRQASNPLPRCIHQRINEAISTLVDGLQFALAESTAMCHDYDLL